MEALTLEVLMKYFEVHNLVTQVRCSLDGCTQLFKESGDGPHLTRKAELQLGVLKRHIAGLLEACKVADLQMSVLTLERMRVWFEAPLTKVGKTDGVHNAVRRAVLVVEDELSLRLYLALDASEAQLYRNPLAGWEKIIGRFPETTRDAEEMNKCFALGRYTASMFHALHVAEWGAIELGNVIGVTDPKKGWGATQRELEKLMKAGHSKLPSHLNGKFEFLEQMEREIQTLVFAWRHKVDHAVNHLAILPNTEFTPEISRHVIDSVKVLMTRLADGV